MGLELLPPDINESDDGFTPVDHTVRYGLTAIKGMGTTSVLAMIDARKTGKFTSIFDFCSRLGSSAVNRRGLESLIAAGAFDSLMPEGTEIGIWRAQNHAAIDLALQQGQRMAEDRMRGQSALFGAVAESSSGPEPLPQAVPWPQTEIARREKAAIGFYLSTHPLDNYRELFTGMRLKQIAQYEDLQAGQSVKIAGMISGLQIRTSKRGNRFAQCRLEDRSGSIKGLLMGENFNKLSSFLADDALFIADGSIEAAEGQEPTFRISGLQSLDEAEACQALGMNITISQLRTDEAYYENLYALLERDRGRCDVFLTLNTDGASVRLQADGLRVNGSRTLQSELEGRGLIVDWLS